ncbi:MAG: VIT1/CCC1 transporter family protein [Thermaerobacter sp.]|nr:VIT1/CCC1 transporter family protein [Thermaerobacter sp.]
MADQRVIDAMLRNWRDEVEGAFTYRELAASEPDTHRKSILVRLAEAEERHAEQWETHIRELGAEIPDRSEVQSKLKGASRTMGRDAWLRKLEADEQQDVGKYRDLLSWLPQGNVRQSVAMMAQEEAGHAESLSALVGAHDPGSALNRLLGRERWHVTSSSGWIGDAIYGANDGLGAIFGIVSGVAGYTNGSGHLVAISGLAGMIASALSMGSGAYLAAKSEGEVHQAEIAREKRELEESPEEESEELALFYQLKGLSEQESHELVARLAEKPDVMLQTLVQEELGLSADSAPNPLVSALSSSVATAVGAIIPVIPFFFMHGLAAVLVAAVISLVAHFVVGALKTIVTARSWLASGLEMTMVGAIEGLITFGLGRLLAGA